MKKTETARDILAANIKKMIDAHAAAHHGKRSRRAWAIDNGITAKQAERAETGETGATVDTLQAIAGGSKCEAWQLLFPGFSQAQPPVAVPMSPEAAEIAQSFDALPAAKRARAYSVISYLLENEGVVPVQPAAATSPEPQPSARPTHERDPSR